MAKTLAQNFSIDFSQVVGNAVSAVKSVRRKEQARREAEFQRAIANGLSYAEQLKLREKWLADEKTSSFVDDEYVTTLEKSVADTKKLVRFQKYREKYVSALNELNSGLINERKYKEELMKQLDGVDDPELRLEIQGDIAEASKAEKTYNDAILNNKVAVAQKDGTAKVLKDTISRVNAARASAAVNENEDEMAAYDETLIALTSQLNTVKVEDAITDFQTKSATLGVSPIEKLDFINGQIQNADAEAPFRVNGKTYNSAKEFWNQQRDQYLAGQSETLGGNFFEELNVFTDGQISKDNAKFGYTTKQALDEVINQYNGLSGRAEMAPFIGALETTKNSSMNGVVLPSPTSVSSPVPARADAALPGAGAAPVVTPAPVETPAATPAPTETPTSTPTATVAAPAGEPDGSAANPFPGQPRFTPGTGIGTKSADGQFIFTESGWKPTPVGAAGAPQAPQYTPGSGDMTLSPDGNFIYRKDKGWEPVTASTPKGKVEIPAAAPIDIPKAEPINIPQAAPVNIPAPAPLATNTPPNYSPATGIGTKSADGKFVFEKDGWKPVLAPINVGNPSLNLASPIAALSKFFGAKTPAPKTSASTPAPVVAPAPAAPSSTNVPIKEYVVAAGDTLSAIAKKSGKTVAQIAEQNSILDPNKIKVGQKLRL